MTLSSSIAQSSIPSSLLHARVVIDDYNNYDTVMLTCETIDDRDLLSYQHSPDAVWAIEKCVRTLTSPTTRDVAAERLEVIASERR